MAARRRQARPAAGALRYGVRRDSHLAWLIPAGVGGEEVGNHSGGVERLVSTVR